MVCVQLEPERTRGMRGGGWGGWRYPGRSGVENKLRTSGEQRLRWETWEKGMMDISEE